LFDVPKENPYTSTIYTDFAYCICVPSHMIYDNFYYLFVFLITYSHPS